VSPSMSDHDLGPGGLTRRGLIVGALAAAGLLATGRPAFANPATATATATGESPLGLLPRESPADPFAFAPPDYQTTVPGESVLARRLDRPVAPGIMLTSFDTFGRTGWTRVHVLGVDLANPFVGVDLLADKVSQTRTVAAAADAGHAVAAVNGDYFDITETYAAEGPEVAGGTLRKATSQHATVATVGADGVARLADLLLQGTVTLAGTARPLAALNSATILSNGITAFTPLWGSGDRRLIGGSGPTTEVVVAGGVVAAVNAQITDAAVPANGLILLGRGTAATALAAAKPGDSATIDFQPQTDSPAALKMALGSGSVLVRDGVAIDFPPDVGNDALKPRTAIAWAAGGRRLLLVTVDGSANFFAGLSFDEVGKLLVRLGAAEALMLDGGGSSELVARTPGDGTVSVVNTPSDGSQRPVPNAVGLFSQPGSGKLRGLDVRLAADRVVPGLTVDVAAAGYDETWAPVTAGKVEWSATPGALGKVSDGVFVAKKPGAGQLRVHSGSADGTADVRVLGDLHRLVFSERAVTMDPGASTVVGLTGADSDGFSAPVAGRDVALDYDKAVVDVTVQADGTLRITGNADAGGRSTLLTASALGVSVSLSISVGLVDVSLAEFEPGETWTLTVARATGSVAFVAAADRPGAPADNHALQLTYNFTGQSSTSAAYAVHGPGPITLPSGAKKLALWVKGDGKQHWLRGMLSSQGTTNVPFTFADSVDWTGWRRVVGDLPAGFAEPITLARIYIVETVQTKKDAGVLLFDGLAAQVGQQPAAAPPPQPDPYVLEQAGLPDGRWTFAVLSDLHVSAGAGLSSFAGRQAALALDQAVAAKPDFLLINGDFVDDDSLASYDLANGLLRDHVPADLPVYWTPGNHEGGLSATAGLDNFKSATGRPTKQVFDHKGTRFILLDSHTGDMRTSDWDQVPLLRSELDKAATDPSVTGVVISFHHPLHDPSGTEASQLSDQLQAGLFARWLADFRESSGKPVALFTGHAHTAAVNRADGVLQVNTPAVGKTPYSSPDQGGFFGWMCVAVDPSPARVRAGEPSPETRDWLAAESRPLIDGVEVQAPDTLAIGATATIGATGITSEFGLRFPLRYPASVTWSGSDGLVVVRGDEVAANAAKDSKTLAVLDLATMGLRAVRAGSVTLTVASGGRSASATVNLS
jgi:predicted phosphodiesterase